MSEHRKQLMKDRFKQLEAENTRYRELLEKHGSHLNTCDKPRFDYEPGCKCTCGLAEALGEK